MSELPESWVQTTLGQVVNYAHNETVDPAEMQPEAWLLELEDIERDTGKVLERKTVGERAPKSTKNRFYAGDVLYGKLRPYLNKVVRADKDGVCSSEIIAISPGPIDANYLFYSMRAPCFIEYVSSVSHGMRMPRLGTQQAKEAPFTLPPAAEQTRIAVKLDELLAQVDTLKARIDGIPALLKRFRQSVLAAAVSGRLTEEWREEKSRQSEWILVPIGSICLMAFDGPFGSKLKSDDYTSDGVRVVRLENIGHLTFFSDKKTYVSHEKFDELSKNKIEPQDVLFSSFVDEEVRVCLFNEAGEKFINKADCFCLRVDDEKAAPSFVMYSLAARSTYKKIREAVHGATRPRINLKFLKNFELALPSLEEQTEIVRRVEQLFAFADQLEARVAAAQERIDKLTQSILAKAFRGELVPQDPNDEPASVLLERIKAQRAAAPKAKRGLKAKA